MAKHTQAEMEKLPFEELKKLAAEPEPEPEPEKVAAAEPEPEEAEEFIARREIDLGGGAGIQVFEATGESREAALEALADKISEAQLNASAKIRQQEAELRDLRAKTAETPKPKEISADDEYVITQELQKTPTKAIRRIFKQLTGCEIEDFATMKQAADAVRTAQGTNEAINTFIATHPDYEDAGEAGTKNGALMRMKLAEMKLPATSENLSKAYSALKQGGLLALKNEEVEPAATEKTKEPARIEQPKVEAAQRVTKKSSGITTHNRTTAVPVNTEPSEDDAYRMPMDKLRELSNKQLAAR